MSACVVMNSSMGLESFDLDILDEFEQFVVDNHEDCQLVPMSLGPSSVLSSMSVASDSTPMDISSPASLSSHSSSNPSPSPSYDPSSVNSPSSSINSSTDTASLKTFPAESTRDDKSSSHILPPCRVCGEKASGLHYGVNTCEACKGFFRRSLQRKDSYKCVGDGNCHIQPGKRNSCPHCRYVKCLAVGMSKEAIKTGRYTHQKRTKDIEEVKKLQGKHDEPTNVDSVYLKARDARQQELARFIEYVTKCAAEVDPQTATLFVGLEEKQKQYMEQFKLKQEMFGQMEPITKEEYKTFYEATGLDLDDRREMIQQWTSMIEVGIRKIVKFAKMIPGFMDLSLQDQTALIKAARFEVGFVSSFRRFNIEFQCFTGLKGNTVHRSEIERVWDKEWIGAIFKEAARLQDLHLTYPENVIFSAIVLLFRDRCELENPEKVEEIQTHLVEALEYSIQTNHQDKHLFAKTLICLVNLRDLSEWNRKVIENIRLDWPDIQFPPLMMEIFG